MKIIEKMVPVKYIALDNGVEIELDEVILLSENFYCHNELRGYEINVDNDTLDILVKYGYVNNWSGYGMANMFALTDKFNELVNLINEENKES